MRTLIILILLAPVLLLNGCSSSNSEAPSDTGAHPLNWFANHAPEALASPNHAACLTCHGPDLRGSGEAVSCFGCHSFNAAPPFSTHPPNWVDSYIDHRGFAAENGADSCAACHGQSLQGRLSAPSCFSASFSGRACHEGGPGTGAHPPDWFVTHGPEALASPDFAACRTCHGTDLRGSGAAVSCFGCHSFNAAPPFSIHPQSWVFPYNDHRSFAAINGTGSCAACHGQNLQGRLTALSCFSARNPAGQPCHADGPGVVPHPLDGTFLLGANHGPVAKADFTFCQTCHGQAGGPGSNPRFNVGIFSAGGNGCESCHGTLRAHPVWPGPNPPVHFSAGNILNSCTLCHGLNLDGFGGVGRNCFDCHTVNPGLNPTGCVSCHNVPPNGGAPAGNVRPNFSGRHGRGGHTSFISNTPLDTCVRCHSGAGTGTVAHFDQSRPADVNFSPDPLNTITSISNATNTTCNGNCNIVGPFGEINFSHEDETWY
jgi:hypothetical protein